MVRLKELSFSDKAMIDMATAYGTLKTRGLTVALDAQCLDISIGSLQHQLLERWGFDMKDLITIELRPDARTMTLHQRWWDRSRRKPVE